MNVVIGLSKCSKTKKIYGIRFEESSSNNWIYTWSFPIKEKQARNEGYGNVEIKGNLVEGEDYPGCPYCEARGFFYCGCGKLNCYDGKAKIATCNWCGTTGELTSGIDSIKVSNNM